MHYVNAFIFVAYQLLQNNAKCDGNKKLPNKLTGQECLDACRVSSKRFAVDMKSRAGNTFDCYCLPDCKHIGERSGFDIYNIITTGDTSRKS